MSAGWMQKVAAIMAALLAGAVVAACGSSSSSGGSGNSTSDSSAKADVAAAKRAVAPYTGHPSAFPVNQALTKPVPSGTKFAYLQCFTPVCGLVYQLMQPAAKALGVPLSVVKAGPSADSLQSALDSILAQKPSALILPATDPHQFASSLKKFRAAGIPVVSTGVMHPDQYGISGSIGASKGSNLAGQLFADWATVKEGSKANVVFYATPELDFSAIIGDALKRELTKVCPGCSLRTANISVSTIGSSAPNRVVSDLQAHPDTNVAVFATQEAATGLGAALKTAGLRVNTIGFGPTPSNLQDIKGGAMTAGLALDLAVISWTLVDMAARTATHQPLLPGEKNGVPPIQILGQRDITFDPSKGWTGYPDFPQRFTKLWHPQS